MQKTQKDYKTVKKTFRLPEKIVDELYQLSFENNISLSKTVIQCLEFALDNLDYDRNILG